MPSKQGEGRSSSELVMFINPIALMGGSLRSHIKVFIAVSFRGGCVGLGGRTVLTSKMCKQNYVLRKNVQFYSLKRESSDFFRKIVCGCD